MKRLKILLLFSYFVIFIFTIQSILYPKKLTEKDLTTEGTIIDISKRKDYDTIILQTKHERYLIYLKEHSFILGDKIYVSGKLKIPEKNRNFYLFHYQNYLKSKKINYIIDVKEIKLLHKNSNFIFKIKNTFLKYLDHFKNKEYFLLFLYGKNELDQNIYQNYKTLGIVHLFALSGMHIHFFIALLSKFLKNKKIIMFLLILYLIFVNPTPSIYRASLMEIICYFGKIKNKKSVLIFLFFLFLFYNPYLIYHIGFQMSFLISYVLLTYQKKYKNMIYTIFSTSFKSFFVSIPILINQTFTINFLTIFYNIFYIPFITYLFFPSILICFLLPPLEFILNYEILFLEKTTTFLANINLFTFSFAHFNILEIFLFYFLIYLFFKRKKYFFLLLFFLFLKYFSHLTFMDFKVSLLDVNQGDSILIEYPNNLGSILIDTGGIKDKNISSEILIPSLKARGIKKIDYLILTHGDYDHMGEAVNLVKNFKVEKVIFNCGEFNDLEKDLIKVLDKKKIKYYSCIKSLNIDNNKLYFLNNKDYGNENDNSSVIYTKLDNHKFLFMGDAGVEVEEDLIEKYNLQDIDVLKVGHHGSKTSSSEEFIDEINPKYSVISVGKNNRYGHPNKEALDNLEDSKIYRTDIDGSIMFKIKNNKLKIETCSP